jgi:hypothetical protein
VLFAVIALLANRRKERVTVVAPSPRKIQPLDVEVYMNDNDSDNFSLEMSLAESPVKQRSILKPQSYGVRSPATSAGSGFVQEDDETLSSVTRGANDDESDMFSGIESRTSPSPSPRNSGGRSVFSFMSAVTRGLNATLPVSNTDKRDKYTPSEVTEAERSLRKQRP